MFHKKSLNEKMEVDYYEENPKTEIILEDVVSNILNTINENIYLFIIPILIFSILFLRTQFIFMDFKNGITYADSGWDKVVTKEDTLIWLKDISNNTYVRYTYDGYNVCLYKGEFYVNFQK